MFVEVFSSIILGIAILVCYWYYKVVYCSTRFLTTIKGPRLVPVLGNALLFKNPTELLETFSKLVQQYNGCVRTVIGFDVSITFTDYVLLEKVHTSTAFIEKSKFYHYLEPWLGTGLLTARNPKWKKHRKLLTPAFHFKILEQFVDVFTLNANVFIDIIAPYANSCGSFDIYSYVLKYALDTICESVMGTSVNAQGHDNNEYVECVKDMSRIMQSRIFSPIEQFDALFKFTRNGTKQQYNLKVLHEFTNNVIKKRRKFLLENPSVKGKLAFLDLLLMSEVDGRSLSNDEIREEVDTFMFEGHDTIASAIGFTLYLLAANPSIQEKAYIEIISVSEKHVDNDIEKLKSLKYLTLVIKESLRLYPSVPFYARSVKEDIEFEGNIIKQGTTVNVFAYGVHRDPLFFKDPEKFDPDRFMTDNNNIKNNNGIMPFSFLPFSAGARNCIGQKFAMLEMKAVLSKFLCEYEVLPEPAYKPVLTADAVLKPQNGIFVKIRRR